MSHDLSHRKGWRRVVVACLVGGALCGVPASAQVTWDADPATSGPQDGSGTWSTSDANWWNGSTDVVWPNLSTSSAIIGASSGAAGTITASGSLTLNAITFNAPGSGAYTLTGGTLGFAGTNPTITANADATIESAITSGVGLTKSGAGTLTLAGSVSNSAGAMRISQGSVTLSGTLTNTATSGFTIGGTNGGLLTIAGGSMSTSWSNARAIVIAAGANQSGTLAVGSGDLSASGLLISEDSGGNGIFTQSGGTVTIGTGNLWLSGNTSSLTVSGGSLTNTNRTYFAVGSTNPSTSTISVSGSGIITMGTLQYSFSGRNGFTATVNVGDGTSGGTLQVSSIVWSGATTAASTINLNGGTFVANGSIVMPSQISTVVQSGGANLSVASAQTLTLGSPLTDGGGGGGLRKLGTGTLVLSGSNAYSGQTTISAGTLALGANGSFGSSSGITVGDAGSSNAVLDLTAKTAAFALGASQSLSGGGTVLVAPGQQFDVQGTFAPGNSPGLFTFDGGTTVLSGTTAMEIFGTSRATSPSHGSGFYDAVDVVDNGVLQFGGILSLEFSSLFGDDTRFDLFSPATGSSLAGNFTGVNVTGSFYTGLSWTQSGSVWTSTNTLAGQSLEFDATNGQLVIVPEPGAFCIAGIGMSLIGWSAWRSRGATRARPLS
jgi:fibronectin-binding autotransporter adhesin